MKKERDIYSDEGLLKIKCPACGKGQKDLKRGKYYRVCEHCDRYYNVFTMEYFPKDPSPKQKRVPFSLTEIFMDPEDYEEEILDMSKFDEITERGLKDIRRMEEEFIKIKNEHDKIMEEIRSGRKRKEMKNIAEDDKKW